TDHFDICSCSVSRRSTTRREEHAAPIARRDRALRARRPSTRMRGARLVPREAMLRPLRGAPLASAESRLYLRGMPNLELIELYPSPFSERVRWALELKGLPYRRTAYVPLAGEEEHKRKTGIATAPVLIADGEVIGDSDHAVEWL